MPEPGAAVLDPPTNLGTDAPPAQSTPVPLPRPQPSRVGARRGSWLGSLPRWLAGRRPASLVAFLAIFTIGPLLLLSTLSVSSTYSALTNASNQRLTDVSALAAVYVETQLNAWMSVEDSYAHRTTLIDALHDGDHLNFDRPAILAVLQDLRTVQSGTRLAGIVATSGLFWGDEDPPTLPQLNGESFSYRDWYQGVTRTGKTYVSSAYASAVQGAPLVIAVAGPVRADGRYAPSGTVVGILLFGFYLTTTQSLFADFASGQGVMIQVTDQHAVIVANSEGAPTKLVQDSSAGVAGALEGKSSVGRIVVGGTDDFAAYSPVAGVGWTVTAFEPASAALADGNRLRSYVITITLVLLAILAAAKLILYVVLRDRQATHLALAKANSSLEQRVAARTADLEASNRELDAFSYSVSHDLRSPLRAIDGFSRLVLEESHDQLSPESTRRLGLVVAGAHQMGTLIDDLLSFSRIGRVELKKRRVSTADIVDEVIAELKLQNPNRRIEFLVRGLPPCNADPTLFKSVFRNLIANAVKFTAKRPAARIEIGARAGTGTPNSSMVTYFVKDNGVGFDMRHSDKLFGVFQRLHRAEDFPGTGVGLALVRRIVERHGGKVWAEAAVDIGATFYLTLEDANATT